MHAHSCRGIVDARMRLDVVLVSGTGHGFAQKVAEWFPAIFRAELEQFVFQHSGADVRVVGLVGLAEDGMGVWFCCCCWPGG